MKRNGPNTATRKEMLASALDAECRMNGPGSNMIYRDVFKLVGQGNVVVSYSLVGLDGADLAVFDIFRIEAGVIVEHWDNAEPIPEGPPPNSGKF
jgi:predicted SnoaL-like aldol condensation-catalyzing enzyme